MVFDDKIRSEPHTPANISRRDKGMTAETSGDSDSGTVCVSDDPRRGARLKDTERKETKAGPSDTTPTRKTTNDNASNDPHTPAGREDDEQRNTS